MQQPADQRAQPPIAAFPPFLSDKELAAILVLTTDWVRSHAPEIPGFRRLGSYYRFCRQAVEQWLGSLDHLFVAEQVATLMKVPESWVYTNANEIPGVLRLGRYVRFRPVAIQQYLAGSDVVQ